MPPVDFTAECAENRRTSSRAICQHDVEASYRLVVQGHPDGSYGSTSAATQTKQKVASSHPVHIVRTEGLRVVCALGGEINRLPSGSGNGQQFADRTHVLVPAARGRDIVLTECRKQRKKGALAVLSSARKRKNTNPLEVDNEAGLHRRARWAEADWADARKVIELQGNVFALLGVQSPARALSEAERKECWI